MAFAVWEPDGKLVACADYKVHKGGRATCDDRFPYVPKEIREGGHIGSNLYGFLVRSDSRGKGLGNILLAMSLLVLEARGVKRVDFVSDATRSDCTDVEYRPQWFSDPENPSLLRPAPMSSFYTQCNRGIAYPNEATVVGTRLSLMQISLIESVFGKPSPELVK